MTTKAGIFVLLIGLIAGVNAFFSVNYQYNPHNSAAIVNNNLVFNAPPSAEQVADLYLRLANKAPMIWEDSVNLPSLSLQEQRRMEALSKAGEKPILLEVYGGVLPRSVVPVIRSSAYDHNLKAPTLDEVKQILSSHGVEVESKSMQSSGDRVVELNSYLKNEQRPVIIMHHELPAAHHYILQRALSSSNSTGLSERDISEYQICLWVGLGFVLLLLASVCGIANMDVIPDSLLYAKFQSGRTGEKRD